MAELDLVRFDGAVECVEFERADVIVIDTDLLAPVVELADPIRKSVDA
jgi:hypothetical protein